MSHTSAGQWVKFFNASGIPSQAAASYAHIFVENRIQIDMLMDINKEYLREMGITLMGDIIAILRHAKTVNDQTTREKVLNSEMSVPIAAVAAIPTPEKTTIKLKRAGNDNFIKSASAAVLPLPKQPRRVLPAHEGKYKIKLPTGTTKRSQEILAKREKLYSDRESATKSHIFERLAKNTANNMQDISHTQSNRKINLGSVEINTVANTSSIFSRLGGKTEIEVGEKIKPILKNSRNVGLSSIKKVRCSTAPGIRTHPQKVILVKKVPLKLDEDYDSDHDYADISDDFDVDHRAVGEKFVKFASTAEEWEIGGNMRKHQHAGGSKREDRSDGVKARLGSSSVEHNRRTINKMNNPNLVRKNIIATNVSKMKSDGLMRRQDTVHKRLGREQKNPYPKLKRMTNLSQPTSANSARRDRLSTNDLIRETNSVFNRLGFNN